MVQRLKSNVPTGITAYRDPENGDVAGSYPRQDDDAAPEQSEIHRVIELQAANAILAQQAADWYALYADRATKERAAIKEITRLREENAELRQLLAAAVAAANKTPNACDEGPPIGGPSRSTGCAANGNYEERTDK